MPVTQVDINLVPDVNVQNIILKLPFCGVIFFEKGLKFLFGFCAGGNGEKEKENKGQKKYLDGIDRIYHNINTAVD